MDRADTAIRRQSLARCQLDGGKPAGVVQADAGDLTLTPPFDAGVAQRFREGLYPDPASSADQAGRFVVREVSRAKAP
jgi:hypothetical protein